MDFEIKVVENQVVIQSLNGVSLYVEFINNFHNFTPITHHINSNFYLKLKLEDNCKENRNAWDLIHVLQNHKLFSYKIKNGILNRIEPVDSFDLTSPIVCITGHHGGGTSVIAKSLRYFGVNLGDDCGDFDNRKAHESVSFRFLGHRILPHVESIHESFPALAQILGCYNYNPNKINGFKITNLSGVTQQLNSIFPNIKFLSIVKHQSTSHLSNEGAMFNEASLLEIYKEQYPPSGGAPVFNVNWNEYFTNYQYANRVLRFIGLNGGLDEDSFNQMLKAIKFETNKLKNNG